MARRVRFLLVLAPCAQAVIVHGVPTAVSVRVVRRAASPLLLETDSDESSVRWFQLDARGGDREPSGAEGSSVMPLFPLGVSYLPHTTHVLNIFEPRYRAMSDFDVGVPAKPSFKRSGPY